MRPIRFHGRDGKGHGKAEDLARGNDLKIDAVFHETLVSAFLTGMDDLHRENVYWIGRRPYCIDADNVLSFNQMRNTDNGEYLQKGFSLYNEREAKKNKTAIEKGDKSVSKLLKTMIKDRAKALEIIDVISAAIAGKHGRVVPISTNCWAQRLADYNR